MAIRSIAWSTTKALVSVLTLWLVLTGCAGGQQEEESGGGQQQQEEEKGAPPIAGSFVGEVPDASAFLAIVADVPKGDGDERDVKAYLCDGQTVSDWFRGSVVGNDLNLSSDGGAKLEGQLASDAATGTITDPSGNSVSFEAPLATGIAGLYNVTLLSDGTLSGTSQTGGQLEGKLADGNALQQYGSYPVSGTITSPDGQPQDFNAFTSPNTSEDHRWIVLADGRIKGGNFGGDYDFDGLVFARQFPCNFYYFDYYDFNYCGFNINTFNFNTFDFEHRDFDFFEHRNDFDRDDVGHDRVGGTFGQVGGGQGGGGGGGGGGKGGGGGQQQGGGGGGGGGGKGK